MAAPDGAPVRVGTTRSLHNRNFRLYVMGQGLSQIGSWFQLTAEIWVIVELTGSGTAVALHSVLRFGPLILLGIPGSLFSGRFNRRMFLAASQSAYGLAALTIAVAAFAWSVTLPLIYGMVLVHGLVFSIENPVKRAFVRDMVSADELPNAQSLNSSMEVLSRAIGPAIAGLVIATIGVEWCFALNAASYTAVLISLFLMDRAALRPDQRLTGEPGQLRAGFKYLWANRRIRRIVLMAVVVSMLAWNWQVVLPIYAVEVLGGDAAVYGMLVGLLGVGAFVGTLVVARLTRISGRFFRVVCVLFAAALAITAAAPSLPFAIAGLALLGAAGTAFQIGSLTRVQLESDDFMIGRILAIYAVVSVGTKPFSFMLAGIITDTASPRVAFGVGAVGMALLATVLTLRRQGQRGQVVSAPQ